ncbi:uncharacterized protein NDAI_0B00450 [Naumovozyma dairenensis CBS 421]|uniref:Sugar phosphate transporter domain-containing protein n=1 Tax=Naumovozyma dairenensis (strain ATCC 10597 / BCRC 20456 / CBS 421 / NBRC 0211 / NRRL Y-12639) TaxID=1071378 RepID=G0W5L8_NAUDC|nr:hypothetical protein NDAI_0B00450 [Naumovozyma dairenensis CBS 421]CCD23079.1 hypothetical protein NDAI_0B00450 [Naumovozyma dairenensis CBS 421]
MLLHLRPHLHIIILCICWYAISSLASQVTKQVLTLCPLPLFLGEFQFLYTALLAALSCTMAYYYPSFNNIFPKGTFPEYNRDYNNSDYITRNSSQQKNIITRPTKFIFKTVLPLSVFQFVGKYFGHKGTSLVPISTVASIKTLSPLFILLFQKMLRIKTLPLTKILYFSLFSLVVGVWIIVREDSKFSTKNKNNSIGSSSYGVICAIISMFIFVGQNIYGKKVFTYKSENQINPTLDRVEDYRENSPLPYYEGKMKMPEIQPHKPKSYDKLTLMIYISLVGFALSFCWFMALEFPIIWGHLFHGTSNDLIQEMPWRLYFLNGTFHFLQAMITFHLLGEISTLTYSIANLMKRIAIISVSWVFVGRSVTLWQIVGLLLNVFGLFLYERCSNKRKQIKSRPE